MKSLRYGKVDLIKDQTYYVSLENIVQVKENTYEIIFDGIEKSKINFLNQTTLLESYEEIIPHLFSITVEEKIYFEIKDFLKKEIYKSKWFKLIVSDKETEMPVSIYIDNNTDEEPVPENKFISVIKQIHSRNSSSKKLNKFFSWKNFKFGNREEITQALNQSFIQNTPHLIHKLNVYNVGQGSLTAITDQFNTPLLYFDLGGGYKKYHNTYSRTLNLCFKNTQTIVISHWDGDHIETARRYLTNSPSKLDNKTWIAPEQKITISYFKLAAKMNATGNLIIWPKSLRGIIRSWFDQLIKCNGSDKNHSGLALIVDSPNNSIKKVLHPADSAYLYIPWISKIKFDGLVSTHHGANFDTNNSPLPNCSQGNIVYSHGNGYGHPTTNSITAHQNAGWRNRIDTVVGNISFTTNNSPNNVACHGANCDLAITRTF